MSNDMYLQAEINALRIVIGAILVFLSTRTSLMDQENFRSFIETSLEAYRKDKSKDESSRQHAAETVQTILGALNKNAHG